MIRLVLLGSPALVVWANHSARVDQNQVKWPERILVIVKHQAKYKFEISLKVPCCKEDSPLIWESAGLVRQALGAVPRKYFSSIDTL